MIRMITLCISLQKLSVGQDIVRDAKKGGYNVKQKIELESKCGDEWNCKFTTSNKSHEVKVEYEPADMNKDGQEVQLQVEAKCEPAPEKWSLETELKGGGFDLGPVKPWTIVSIKYDDSSMCQEIPTMHVLNLFYKYLAQIQNRRKKWTRGKLQSKSPD